MNAAQKKRSWVQTGANLLSHSTMVSQPALQIPTLHAPLFSQIGIRELASFLCLYEIPTTANLMERFDEVDTEAHWPVASAINVLQNLPNMKGPIGYVGGKSRIANKIISLFPPHKTYVEVFAGGAQVLFHKKRVLLEVMNDLDGDIVTFFRVCQSHHEEL